MSQLSLDEANALLTAPGAEFEVATETIRGVETRVWTSCAPSIRALLEASEAHGERDFLVYRDERWSYRRHHAAVCSVARYLSELGVEKGDRVALAARNLPEWSVAFFAVTALGAIAVPLNAWWTGDELAFGLRDSGTRVVIADEERLERLRTRLPQLGLERGLALRTSADTALPAGWRRFAEALRDEGAEEPRLPRVTIAADDDATIFYTSGTTGVPKGALGTHRNLCTNVRNLEFLRRRGELRTGVAVPEDVQLASLLSVPLFHVTGCHSTLVPALAAGSKLVLVYRFDADETVRLIERERITSFGGVPTLVWRVLASPELEARDLSSVLRVGYGGAPAAPELVRRIAAVFPQASPSNGYGLTETSALAVSNAGEDYKAKPDSVGRPVPVCEARICDDDGRELPVGDVGELRLKGPNVIKGYWGREEATAEAIVDGWLRTGDIARCDADGDLYIVDRAKDMVIRGGENVYCVEVESALYEHPDVRAAAVFGVPHRELGEEVAASVELRPDADIEAETLRAWLGERIAGFKIPAHLELRSEPLPLNANGKVMKRSLREEFLERRAAAS